MPSLLTDHFKSETTAFYPFGDVLSSVAMFLSSSPTLKKKKKGILYIHTHMYINIYLNKHLKL